MPFDPSAAPGSRYSEPTGVNHSVAMRTPWRAIADWCLWAFVLKGHKFCLIDTDSMGCPRTEYPGRITRLWTAPYDSKWDQAGYLYAFIRYEDGSDDRLGIRTGKHWPRHDWYLFWNDESQRYERTT